MMISAFDVIGPPMIGPSSSHTAGACRIGLVAWALCGGAVAKATIGLHGSFAAAAKGHSTDRAILAGLQGIKPDDVRLSVSDKIARNSGLDVQWETLDLGDNAHPNSAHVQIQGELGDRHCLVAASVGGGMIEVRALDGYPTSFSGGLETMILWHEDRQGFLSKLTTLLACDEANIATIRSSRIRRGENALTVVEVDASLPDDLLGLIFRLPAVSLLRRIPKLL